MIGNLFTTVFTLKRMVYETDEETGITKGEKETATGFNGYIQQASPDKVQSLASAFTITHLVWCATTDDVQEADEITEGGNTYSVKAIQMNNYGENKYQLLYCQKNV
jgi:hypothetical protein